MPHILRVHLGVAQPSKSLLASGILLRLYHYGGKLIVIRGYGVTYRDGMRVFALLLECSRTESIEGNPARDQFGGRSTA
jgi:hypothetical protein